MCDCWIRHNPISTLCCRGCEIVLSKKQSLRVPLSVRVVPTWTCLFGVLFPTDILKNRWDLARLFQFNPDFESQEFGDQMFATELAIDKFRKEYLRHGALSAEKFTQGLTEINGMRDTVAKLEAYRTANCILYNTEGRKVDTIGKANFEKMCALTRE